MSTRRARTPFSSYNHRIFYGYVIVLCALLTVIVVFGTRFVFGVFFKPLAAEFDWTSAQTSAAFSISIALEGFFGVLMGALTDRFGPRIVLTFCGFLLGLGYIAMSLVGALWQLYLLYGVVIGIAMGGFFVPLVTTIPRWFTQRRGVMTGVVLTGTGIGTLIASPVANWLIYTYDWRTSYIILGSTIFVIVILAAQFLRRDPSRVGLLPYGESSSVPTASEANSYTLKAAARVPQFWFVTLAYTCYGFCVFATIVHVVPSAIEREITATNSANVLAILGGLSILGRLTLGSIGDKIGNRKTSIVGFALMTAALFWLISATQFWIYALFAVVFGFGNGGTGALQSPIVAELFGLKSHGLIFGVCGIGFTIGSALGPLLNGYLFDTTQNYQTAFLVSSVVGIVGIIFLAVTRPLKKSDRLG